MGYRRDNELKLLLYNIYDDRYDLGDLWGILKLFFLF